MNKDQIDYLSKKIVQITNHIEKQLDDKRALMRSYTTEIKDSQKRLNTYARAVGAENIEILNEVMGEFELAEFEKIGRGIVNG
jgi:ribosomal protein S15P/S13E